MRRRSFTVLVLAALFVAPLIISAPGVLRGSSYGEVVHTTDQTWSGNISLNHDVTISASATLTIEAGTRVNVTDDVTITIDGNLLIQGIESNPVVIWGSWIAETSIQARWQGFLLNPGSSGIVSNAEISDSRGGLDIESGATLTIDNTTFTDNMIGVWAKGTLSGQGFGCNSAAISCLRVDGSAALTSVNSTLSSEVVHIHNGGDANITAVFSVADTDVIVLEDGSIFSGTVNADGFSRLVRGSGTVTATVVPNNIGFGEVLVEANSLAGLVVTGSSPCIANCTVNSMLIGSVEDVQFSSMYIFCNGITSCIDARIDGTLSFLGAWPSTNINASSSFARFRGDGVVEIGEINIQSGGTLFDVSGDGRLEITNSTLQFIDGGTISGWSLELSNTVMTGNADGMTLLDVDATFIQSELSRTFSNSDTTSVGLHAVWSDIMIDDLEASGWNEGIRCESECVITGSDLSSGGGGRNAGSGLTIVGGSVSLDNLQTSASDVGISVEAGHLHVDQWVIDMAHRTYGIELSDNSQAVIRNMPGYTTSGLYDGFGDGTLIWGSSGTPSLAVSVEDEFSESTVHVTDLVGNSISGAIIAAHGFSSVTDANGDATLPLLSAGSQVQAYDPSSGLGSESLLTPPGGDILIAVVPGSGDWIIPSGVHARLVDGFFTINGDLEIENAASLYLSNSTLVMPEQANLTIASNGQLIGNDGTLSGGIASLTAGVPLKGEGEGLTLTSSVTFTCYDPWTWFKTTISGDLHLNQDCELVLDGGEAEGTVTIGIDASLTQQSQLTVTVLDAGLPVQGANVSVGGSLQTTDTNGQITASSIWRTFDENGDSQNTAQRTVVIQHANINRYRSWQPISNAEIEVMISTVPTGATNGFLRLDSVFSPWHLGGDLLVSSGTTLEVLAGVELSQSTDSSFIVEGTLRAEDAWFGGTASGGIDVKSGGLLSMDSSSYSGGPISISGHSDLSHMMISDAPMTVSNSGTLSITDGTISNTDICLRVTGYIQITGTTIQDCSMYGIWTTAAQHEITDLEIGTGIPNGAWIQQGTGNLSGWNSSSYDGDGSVLFLQMVDESLQVHDMDLHTTGGGFAVSIEQSNGFELFDSTITGSPGINIEDSNMRLLRVDLFNDNSGTGIFVHGVPSAGMIIEDCDVDGYETALSLEGGLNDLEGQGVSILQSHLHASVSIDSNTLPFTLSGGEIDGEIRMRGPDKSWSANIVDYDYFTTNITGSARLYASHTWTVQAPTGINLTMIIPDFDFDIGEQSLSWNNPTSLVLLHEVYTSEGKNDAWVAQWSAELEGYLPASGQLQLDTTGQRHLSIEMLPNLPPVVTIISPQSNEINAGLELNYSATALDPNGDQIIEWVWVIEADDMTILLGNSATGSSLLGEQGEWILRASAYDANGAVGHATMALTVNPSDNDGDNTETCPQSGNNAWWDSENNRFCGPDIFDLDDDNDDYKDDFDSFPNDPCAHHDTDNDGLPNSIRNGCVTTLTEDTDDDNDGILDSNDADPTDPNIGDRELNEESSFFVILFSPPVVLTFAVIVVFSTFAYMRSNGDIKRE